MDRDPVQPPAAVGGDIPRFTLGAFLADRGPVMAWAVLVIACVAFFLHILGLNPNAIAFVSLFLASCSVVPLAAAYLRTRRFWKDAAGVAEAVDKVELFCELAEEPPFLEGRISFAIAETLAAKSTVETSALKEEMRSEREYAELWTHEVKAPLAASKLALEGMHGDAAAILKEQIERTESLVEQALYKSRMTSLAADYTITETGLLDCVREACKANMRFLVGRGVALEFAIPEDLTVLADGSWLRFIVSQLVLNAAKYDASVIRFSARQTAPEGTSASTVLEVADDGCGIPAKDVPRVFNRGFTGEVGRRHGSATGMGLYLVAFMSARMGLAVSIASQEGSGTRVSITFPHDRRRLWAAGALNG